MGHIRWKATPIVKKLDRIDKMLNEIEPTFRDMVAQVKLAQQQPNLPDYMRERLSGLDDELSDAMRRILSRVASVRSNIPEDALERESNDPLSFLSLLSKKEGG